MLQIIHLIIGFLTQRLVYSNGSLALAGGHNGIAPLAARAPARLPYYKRLPAEAGEMHSDDFAW